MAASEWILVHGETLQVVLFFALLPLLAVMKRLLPRRPKPLARRLRWPVNLGLTALNFVALSLLPVSLVAAALWAASGRWGLLHRLALPAAAGAVVTLLVRAFLSFATHWLMHRVPLLWRVHRVHHLDTELDVTTTVRFHPLEFALGLLPGVPIVIAFGLPPGSS